jgi:hypothetical protein
MATRGYDPHQTLWHLFHVSVERERALTESERKQIDNIVGIVTEHRMHPDGSQLVDRFANLMQEKNGKILTVADAALAQGLLECLDPYQAYEPYTRVEAIRLGIHDHFKGGIYKVKGFSAWASGVGEKVVEYDSMIFGTPHTRLATQWCEVVEWPDGKFRSRFVYRGPDLKTPAPVFKVPSPE